MYIYFNIINNKKNITLLKLSKKKVRLIIKKKLLSVKVQKNFLVG